MYDLISKSRRWEEYNGQRFYIASRDGFQNHPVKQTNECQVSQGCL